MAGAVPADPWSAGIMAAGSIANGAVSDKTNMTNGVSFGAGFDNSGWNVNVGAGASQSTQTDRSQAGLMNLGALLKNPLVLAALAFVAYQLLVKGK